MSGTVPWYISNTAPTMHLTVASRVLRGHPNWICVRFWIPCLSGRSPRRAAGGVLLLLLLLLFFYFLKVSKVYSFFKFFNFWPLYLLPELRNPHMLPGSPELSPATLGAPNGAPKFQTIRRYGHNSV